MAAFCRIPAPVQINTASPLTDSDRSAKHCHPQHQKDRRELPIQIQAFPNTSIPFVPKTVNFTSSLTSFLDLPHGRRLHSAFSSWHDPLSRVQLLRICCSCSRLQTFPDPAKPFIRVEGVAQHIGLGTGCLTVEDLHRWVLSYP